MEVRPAEMASTEANAAEEDAASAVPCDVDSFLASGSCLLLGYGSEVVFLDPVRVLGSSYSRFRVSASAYYSRSFQSSVGRGETDATASSPPASDARKRKRKRRHGRTAARELNERERDAERRHQEARPFLLRAHQALLRATNLLEVLPDVVRDGELPCEGGGDEENDFVALGGLWQAPLYEISLGYGAPNWSLDRGDALNSEHDERTLVPMFNNLISNETGEDLEAEFMKRWYILPRRCCFHMSDFRQIQSVIPAQADDGFNLIVVDPPWENGSANQKSVYPMLPNRYFLHLPVNQLAHAEGALLVLWVTNREKLRVFVEKELLPAWGVTSIVSCYWLKVKADGSLIGELDLFHHRPYECFLLGYINGKHAGLECKPHLRYPENNQVFISIPGAYSRKPPVGKLLIDYIPGPKPPKCIDLFARELCAGWTSWGNEPLHFQDSRYFVNRSLEE